MAAKGTNGMSTPIPRRDIEMRSSGCGPVTTYFLSEEELNKMRENDKPACGLTKEILLEQVAAGESLSSIEKAWGMKYNTIHSWVKKWGLKGIKPEQAYAMIEQAKAQASGNVSTAARQPEPDEKEPVGKPPEAPLLREKDVTPPEAPEEAGAEFRRLKEENAQLAMQIKGLQTENESFKQVILQYRLLETGEQFLNHDKQRAYEGACITGCPGLYIAIRDLEHHRKRADEAEEKLRETFERHTLALDKLQKEYDELADRVTDQNNTTTISAALEKGIVTLTYALLDFGGTRDDQRRKCIEESDEYAEEIEAANIDLTRAVSELYDASQSFVGLIRKQFQELLVDDVDGSVRNYFEKHNARHLAKMREKAGIA